MPHLSVCKRVCFVKSVNTVFHNATGSGGVTIPCLLIAAFLLCGSFAARAEDRTLSIFNVHTREKVTVTYRKGGVYVPDAMAQLNHITRDWRRNVAISMDPALFDLIWEIHRELGSKQPVHLISGHRSDKTNALLRRIRGGQARKSRHITGQAADIHFPDIPLKQLRNSALIREKGGVGYYPGSGSPFVHIDTGNVRHWPRLPRQELALLFPSGRSRHVPADGRPITKDDYRVALAKLQESGGEMPWALQRRSPQPMLASLTPNFSLSGLGPKIAPAPMVKPVSLQENLPLGLMGKPNSGMISAPLPQLAEPETVLSEEGEEEDDIVYEPIPLGQVLSELPLSYIDIPDAQQAIFQRAHLLIAASTTFDVAFERGIRIEEFYEARRFGGPVFAVALRARSKTAANAGVATAQTKLAAGQKRK
jgi:uncharacterized protein YcbK (DUF882 family)